MKKDAKLETARENCREALAEARKLQQELEVEGLAQCRLIPTFNHLTVEGVNALTEDFVRAANECRAVLAEIEAEKARIETETKAKAEADAKAAYAASPAGLLEILANAAKLESARKSVTATWQTLRACQKELGVPSENRERLPRDFDELSAVEYEEVFEIYAARVIELVQVIHTQRANELARAQAEAEAAKRKAADELAKRMRAATIAAEAVRAADKLERETCARLTVEYRTALTSHNDLAEKLHERPRPSLVIPKATSKQLKAAITELRGAVSRLNTKLIAAQNLRAKGFARHRRAA